MPVFSDLTIQTVERSRLDDVDFDKLGFGDVFSDHMFSLIYEDGRWHIAWMRHPNSGSLR